MDNIHDLAQGLAEIITAANQLTMKRGSIMTGTVQGSCVTIGAKTYFFDLVVDMSLFDGQQVMCQLSADGTRAVIVGAA